MTAFRSSHFVNLRRTLSFTLCTAAAVSSFLPAQAASQPLPGSVQSVYFLFKLASSLMLSDTQTVQCDASIAALAQSDAVTVSHSFVLPETTEALELVLNEYAQSYQFTAVGTWNTATSGSLSRRFIDPDVQGYSYAVNLHSLQSGQTALCISVLSMQ